MSPKNIVRLKIIYCVAWLAYPFWLGAIVQTALWGGAGGLGFLAQECGRAVIALTSSVLLALNIFIGLTSPAKDIVGSGVFYEGPTWDNLLSELRKLHDLKQAEIEEAKAKRAREIEDAVRLAQEIRR